MKTETRGGKLEIRDDGDLPQRAIGDSCAPVNEEEAWIRIAAENARDANARLSVVVAQRDELLAACKSARQFIVNGIEYGYILMPEEDCPDSAHDTLPQICAAIAKAEGR